MLRRFFLSLTLLGGFVAAQASAQSCDTTIQVANASGAQVEELYFNPASIDDWGRDRLGDNVLESGRAITCRPGRGGKYDFRVVWNGGREAEIRGVDICTISRVTVGRGRLSAD